MVCYSKKQPPAQDSQFLQGIICSSEAIGTIMSCQTYSLDILSG